MSEQVWEYDDRPRRDASLQRDSVGAFFNIASQYELLNSEQEQELSRQIQAGLAISPHLEALNTPDELSLADYRVLSVARQARDELVLSNLRLVAGIAKKYRWSGLAYEELLQEGTGGLTIAAEKFDPDRGFKFSTYATQWIRQNIGRACDKTARPIRLPTNVEQKLNKLRKYQQANPDEDFETACQAVGFIDPQRAQDALKQGRVPLSFSMPLGENGGELGDLLADKPDNIDMFEAADQDHDYELLQAGIDIVLANDRLSFVIKSRAEGLTLEQVGSELGISSERVRQLEVKARDKLRRVGENELYRLGLEMSRSNLRLERPASSPKPRTVLTKAVKPSEVVAQTELSTKRDEPRRLSASAVKIILESNDTRDLGLSSEQALALGHYSLSGDYSRVASNLGISKAKAGRLIKSGLNTLAAL